MKKAQSGFTPIEPLHSLNFNIFHDAIKAKFLAGIYASLVSYLESKQHQELNVIVMQSYQLAIFTGWQRLAKYTLSKLESVLCATIPPKPSYVMEVQYG